MHNLLLYYSYFCSVPYLPEGFSPFSFLQVICSFIFGWFVTLSNLCLFFLPVPESYIIKLIYIIVSLFFVAVGVFLYVNANLLPLPGEGVMLTFSKRTKIPFHLCKMGFDCSVAVIAALISLIADGELLGVREGTIIAAVFVGIIIKPVAKLFLNKLKDFLKVAFVIRMIVSFTAYGYSS